MDGNNRWSKINSVNKNEGYKRGAENLLNLTKYVFNKTEANYVSAFALSKNNLSRSISTLNTIKRVLSFCLDKIEKEKIDFNVKFIGDLSFLDNNLKKKIQILNDKKPYIKNLIIFMNYGGLEDIEYAAKKYLIHKNKFSKNLLTSELPDPDLLIRTGGFNRISNFMLYQISFTEIFFYKKLWADYKYSDLSKTLIKFRNIERKFGK